MPEIITDLLIYPSSFFSLSLSCSLSSVFLSRQNIQYSSFMSESQEATYTKKFSVQLLHIEYLPQYMCTFQRSNLGLFPPSCRIQQTLQDYFHNLETLCHLPQFTLWHSLTQKTSLQFHIIGVLYSSDSYPCISLFSFHLHWLC